MMNLVMKRLRRVLRFASLLLGFLHAVTATRCAGRACSPPMGNLASGRTLYTSNSSQEPRYSPALMADDPFLHPNTWWESSTADGQDEIRLDLEDQFFMTHVVMVFRSPRPAAMSLERSQDFGNTWRVMKLFAKNCSAAFGMPDDVNQKGALCTSRYSSEKPCTGGEVIFRPMVQNSDMNPYGPEAVSILSLTNLRIRLFKAHRCPVSPSISSRGHSDALHPEFNISRTRRKPTHSDFTQYAVYSLLARGTCLCHGHAENCLPFGEQDALQRSGVVQGGCVCTHHTAGPHCEKCAPFYNDRPWRAANGKSGEPNPCQKCECHGHAHSCHFSPRVWQYTAGISGGVCDECQHNTAGRRCHRCRLGYRRHPARLMVSPQACTRCWCDPVGSDSSKTRGKVAWCHPRSGHCLCKPGVGGTSCSHCLPGYRGLGLNGCRPCGAGHCSDSKTNGELYNIPIGGQIPDLTHFHTHVGENKSWSKELTVSAIYHTGRCICKERKLKSVAELCRMKHAYVIKASVLSAHDKGTHVVVRVKVRKVLRSGMVTLHQGTHSLYPLSWTSRGCTCPVLNPGGEYLLAGSEEVESGRLLVTMKSLVVPWTPTLGLFVSEALQQGCMQSEHLNVHAHTEELKMSARPHAENQAA